MPTVDLTPLFGRASPARDVTDRIIAAAAVDPGIMKVAGFPDGVRCGSATRGELLRLFGLPRHLLGELACNRHDPSRPLVLNGWSDVREMRAFYYEGFEIGPDVAHGAAVVDRADPLRGPTPRPADADLPGWWAAVREYFLGMERVVGVVMQSIARGLGVAEQTLCDAFVGGQSALKLLRYPVRSSTSRACVPPEEGLYVLHDGIKREVINEAHADFGFITLLDHDVGGLQVKLTDGAWVEVPPADGSLVVNFGTLLERWTSGRVRASEHRVLSKGRERYTVAFFYAPNVAAEISPLPLEDARPFAPFRYGDHVWDSQPKLRRLFGGPTGKRVRS